MKQWNKNLSFISLFFKSARPFIVTLFLTLFLSQIGMMYINLHSLTYQETGYDFASPTFNWMSEFSETAILEYAPSFAELVDLSHFAKLFLIHLLTLSVLIGLIPMQMKTKTVRQFTLERLPLSPAHRFYLMLVSAAILMLLMVFMENLIIAGSYLLYQHMIPAKYLLTDELFMAYLTNGFLRMVCPVTSPLLLMTELSELLTLCLMSLSIGLGYNKAKLLLVPLYMLILTFTLMLGLTSKSSQIELLLTLLGFLIVFLVLLHRNGYTFRPKYTVKKRRIQ